MSAFALGDRVRIDTATFSRNPKLRARVGVVVGFSANDCVRVRWDGNAPNTVYSYWVRFLQRVTVRT